MAIFMKFGAMDGEVTALKYEKWIELQSFQWGVGRGISAGVGGASKREASAPSVSEITVTKTMDAFSPLALQEALGGKGVTVKIELTRTDAKGNHVAFKKYVLDGTMISGYSLSSGGDRPSESISLNFSKVSSEYFNIDDKFAASKAGGLIYDLTLAQIV
jgi:type VI secretion system secreted protein Hcp